MPQNSHFHGSLGFFPGNQRTWPVAMYAIPLGSEVELASVPSTFQEPRVKG